MRFERIIIINEKKFLEGQKNSQLVSSNDKCPTIKSNNLIIILMFFVSQKLRYFGVITMEQNSQIKRTFKCSKTHQKN